MKHLISKTTKWLILPAIASISFFAGSYFSAETLPIDESLIDFHTTQGRELLFSSAAQQDYLPLSEQFVTQINGAYCGIASMVIALNALGIEAPFAPELGEKYFTQTNIFNTEMENIHPADKIRWQGMTLSQLGQLLSTYPVDVEVHHGSDLSLSEFRELVRQNLQEPNNYILVNYLRRAINQESGGHISPIAAYNEESDRLLILDVATYKYPPVWVTVEDLWAAINTIDPSVDQTRGLVAISKRNE
ncbi:Glutathione gamma-glutamylcysteinyltransferase [[Leptolyngbya] sp. PCC 7376]|uniref:phytochelatin synthase family protein n=1 Tax=[Leptolyngbya] sp. PCC 7376 TaxID=111781 RepID=UPI00029EF1E9|nr:phytochelatin synthase family protein [[Leptolyngbya] sp. PCC 7376]AFY37132.1 Glutathione gamma-glutamylcysteinyltransferase [[Leptolyngbya] sp. PCC 7376]